MKAKRQLRIATLIVVILAIGLLLNFHKDIIQNRNIKRLIAEQLDGRMVPHRINSPERLGALLESGIRSYEVDLLYRPDTEGGYFEVGHDEADASGIRFDRFLDMMPGQTCEKIWLDVKNIGEDNIQAVTSELLRLDSAFEIRTKVIVESSSTGAEFASISMSGFHTSYYLPTGRLTALLELGDYQKLSDAAEAIRAQIEEQQVSAVSFSLTLYPFVKEYLEPIIPEEVVYHTWDSVKLWEWDAVDRLHGSGYFKDSRIRTILYGYWS